MAILTRRRRSTPGPKAGPPVATSREYGGAVLSAQLGTTREQLSAAEAKIDELTHELRAARAELSVRPAADPVLLHLARNGPAATDVLALELGLPVAEVASRMGTAMVSGVVGCIDTPNGVVWHLTRDPNEVTPC